MSYDTGSDETSSDKERPENEECIFDFLFCFRRLYAHKWYINDRPILRPPEESDDEEAGDDVHESDGPVFWSSCYELSELYESGVHV